MICGVMLRDKMESTVIASRVGVDDLEAHFRQKRLMLFRHIVRRGGDKESIGFGNRRVKKEWQASEMMD